MNLFDGPYGEPEPGWPRDADGYFICDAIKRCPENSLGNWNHVDAYSVGQCDNGCCYYMVCPNCHLQFTVSDND